MIDEKKIEEAAINTSIEDTDKGRVREDYVIGAMADHELGFQDGFKAGINWFKENLWHDASEEPKLDKPILLELASNDYVVVKLRSKYDFSQYPCNKAYRWLYIEDLMKGEK